MSKHVFFFGGGESEGKDQGKEILGGKGSGLSVMTALGIPVPPGFTISTEVCTEFFRSGGKYPDGVHADVTRDLERVGKLVGATFGDPKNPLLVSVRSGARASMPGMMDTVLNLGLNDATVEGMVAATGNPRFVYDAYRRFVTMYANVVLGVGSRAVRARPARSEAGRNVRDDSELSAEALEEARHATSRRSFKQETGKDFPRRSARAALGRRSERCSSRGTTTAPRSTARCTRSPTTWGTACNVQAMVFGNMGDDCAHGRVLHA